MAEKWQKTSSPPPSGVMKPELRLWMNRMTRERVSSETERKRRWVARRRGSRRGRARGPACPADAGAFRSPSPPSRARDLSGRKSGSGKGRADSVDQPADPIRASSSGREGRLREGDAKKSMYAPNPREFHLPAMPTLRPAPPPPYAPGDLPRSSARGGSRDLERDLESRPRGGGERERSLPRSGEGSFRSPSGASARSGVGERGGASSPLIFLPMKRGANGVVARAPTGEPLFFRALICAGAQTLGESPGL
jgi:hypothetical protein